MNKPTTSTASPVDDYAFNGDKSNGVRINERTAVYGSVGDGSARDARTRAAAIRQYNEQQADDTSMSEAMKEARRRAGQMPISSFWLRPSTTLA